MPALASCRRRSPCSSPAPPHTDTTRTTMEATVSVRDLEIDGVRYKLTSKRRPKKPGPPELGGGSGGGAAQEEERRFDAKLDTNRQLQSDEVSALRLLYGDKFRVEDEHDQHFSIEFFVRGGQDATLQLTFPPHYPSDVPPTYTLNAPWMRDGPRRELYKQLTHIYSENFGRCIIYLWADKIREHLRDETEDLRRRPQEEAPAPESPDEDPEPECDPCPAVVEGPPIWDRGSCFSPYLAVVASQEQVNQVLSKIESCRKVSGAWRNTYAFRFRVHAGFEGGKATRARLVEEGEDGGEPKAGRHLLQRLINYKAMDVIVFISRRVGGRLLGADRFKHLNNAADSVLISQGFKGDVHKDQGKDEASKEAQGGTKRKEKKGGKKKK